MTAEQLAEAVRTRPAMAWAMIWQQMANLHADGLRTGGTTLGAAMLLVVKSIAHMLAAPVVAAALAWCLVKAREREPDQMMEWARELCRVYEPDEG